MFGSDWPVATLGGSYAQVIDLAQELTQGFSPSEGEYFWSKTAISAYNLA